MVELLRPPPHRGPLIAAGAVVLAVGLALAALRLDDELAAVYHLLMLAPLAALLLALGLQAPSEDGAPAGLPVGPARHRAWRSSGSRSCGSPTRSGSCDSLHVADRHADRAAGHQAPPRYRAARTRSAICLLLAAIALGVTLVGAIEWLFEPGRLHGGALAAARAGAPRLVLASLGLRAGAPRHAELLIDGAGLAILAIALQAFFVAIFGSFFLGGGGGEVLPGFWELVVLVAGFGLSPTAAIDRVPGPAWLGVANLLAFMVAAAVADDDTLTGGRCC